MGAEPTLIVSAERVTVGNEPLVQLGSSEQTNWAIVSLDVDGQTVATVPRTSGREIHRYKAYATQQPRRPR
ncbi:MAG: hypothetical protein WAK58_10140 [Trebonia sp.]